MKLTAKQVRDVAWDGKEDFKAVVERLRELAEMASSEDEARMVISRIAQLTREYRLRTGIGLPLTPLEQARELDSKFVVRPHLEYISNRLARAVRDVERGKNRKMAISLPPRSGKTFLVSQKAPLWMLRRHPEWKIVQASYDSSLPAAWAKNVRTEIEAHPDLGIALKSDGGAGSRWDTMEDGGIYTTSIRGALTGRGARVVIIDDPIKDFVDAHSLTMRQNIWDWWLSVVQTRLEPPYLVIVVMCMTGDTPVLRPDGTETPLRDIRVGDEIATFTDEGEVTTSVVSNWASQGVDDTFAVHLASGRVVRANARHPFWVVGEDGSGSWVRLGSLRAGMRVRCLTEPTEGLSARQMTATSPLSARACACRITPEHATQQAIGHRRRLMRDGGRSDSKVGTASRLRATTDSSLSKASVARSAEDTLVKSPSLRTGPRSSASITAMTAESCEVCSATTATLSLLAATRPTSFDGPLSTSVVSTDEIVSIVPAGREEVFDIEVVGTHRFIANGLDVSNTRWHEDDFIGRLLSPDYEGDPREWEQVVVPAIAENNDPIGRMVGDPLLSPIIEESRSAALDRWDDVKRAVGTYVFSAMYQQRPAPARGAVFDVGWWRYWTSDPSKVTEDGRIVYIEPGLLTGGKWCDSWDMAFKGGTTNVSDYVVGQRWVRNQANRYLITQVRNRWSFTQTLEKMRQWARTDDPFVSPHGHLVHDRLVEDKANGTAIIDTLRDHISGLKPVNPTVSKEARARAVTPEVESGNVYLPLPSDPGNEWVQDLLSELRNFPHDASDDQVDCLSQALSYLRDSGRGGITVPGQKSNQRPTQKNGQTWQVPRDLARTALRDMSRRRY